MTKIFIVRHGQDVNNANRILGGRDDKNLTDLGRAQAIATAKKLKDKKIDVIYSSPLKRAVQTAKIIARELGIGKINFIVDLMERDMGVMTGIPLAEIKNHTSKLLLTDRVTYFLEAEGAEDFPALYKRAERVLGQIKSKHQSETVLIVAHSDIGKMIRAVHENRSWEEELKGYYFGNAEILELV